MTVKILFIADKIILCDGCNVCTHYSCYGGEFALMEPKGNKEF